MDDITRQRISFVGAGFIGRALARRRPRPWPTKARTAPKARGAARAEMLKIGMPPLPRRTIAA
jgi:hypothetical protein